MDDGLTLPPLRVTEKKGRTFDVPPVAQPVDANFGNRARLVGFNTPDGLQISRSECGGNCAVQVETVWQGIGEMEQPYRIFAHLVGPAGGIAAQSDAQPGERGRHPTTGWLPGEVVTHPVRIALPPDVTPGSYTLRLGMYLPPAGPRLPVENSANDFVDIATVTVK
ncbi:MAG: hypothetical protein D6768_09730 [Chloroflexi bacterium]|nr:MAG: hypothetical protein D6768_09730 [Chloroflexota bacterium]